MKYRSYSKLGFLEYGRESLVAVINSLFCDEGGKYQKDPLVSFAGVLASPSRLSKFDEEWNAWLKSCGLSSFHMKVLANVYDAQGTKLPRDRTVDQTIDALLPFADCINRHLESGLIEIWDVQGYINLPTEAKARLGGAHSDPHYLAFVRGILEAETKIQVDDHLSLVCDDDEIKAWDCYLHYRAVCKAMPELKRKFTALTFANDQNYPALQAADMVAFLSRQEARARFSGTTNEWKRLFDYLTTDPLPSIGLMRWTQLIAGEPELLALANGLQKPLA